MCAKPVQHLSNLQNKQNKPLTVGGISCVLSAYTSGACKQITRLLKASNSKKAQKKARRSTHVPKPWVGPLLSMEVCSCEKTDSMPNNQKAASRSRNSSMLERDRVHGNRCQIAIARNL